MNVPSPRETLPHSTLYRSERASQKLASSFASPPPSAGSCAAAFDAALLAAPLAPVACAHAVLPTLTASTKLTDATACSHCLIEHSPQLLQVPTARQAFVPPTGPAARSQAGRYGKGWVRKI